MKPADKNRILMNSECSILDFSDEAEVAKTGRNKQARLMTSFIFSEFLGVVNLSWS